mgnify:FL=1|jgi:hypothetical protein
MVPNDNINQEIDFVTVIEDSDDFVQILGVSSEGDDNEIEVSFVEIDGDDSIFVDIEDPDMYEEVDGFDIDTQDTDTYDSIDDNDLY